jgi:hypothetical protein
MMLPGGMAMNSVQSEMDSWTGAQHAFAIKSFYKNNDSYIAAQSKFPKKIGIHQNSKVPSAHAIKMWVNNFKRPAQLLRKVVVLKLFEPHRTVHDRLAECEQCNGGHLEDVIF